MLLKDIIGKEVIDLEGRRLGKIRKVDIIMEASTGQVEAIILGSKNNRFLIPWHGIKQIGSRVVLIDNALKYIKK
ncbi:MAG: YlmC/YmxH family sporulation protein [Halanaerobiaceae bacterium]|nr:YlmC/YmxH family sporulation protein [Halanaerobiaceae bacterium]